MTPNSSARSFRRGGGMWRARTEPLKTVGGVNPAGCWCRSRLGLPGWGLPPRVLIAEIGPVTGRLRVRDYASHKEQARMIRRYIIWSNNHAYDERLRRIIDRQT